MTASWVSEGSPWSAWRNRAGVPELTAATKSGWGAEKLVEVGGHRPVVKGSGAQRPLLSARDDADEGTGIEADPLLDGRGLVGLTVVVLGDILLVHAAPSVV